eukprot:5806190-Pyramimonas_sp.AAC.1
MPHPPSVSAEATAGQGASPGRCSWSSGRFPRAGAPVAEEAAAPEEEEATAAAPGGFPRGDSRLALPPILGTQ